MNTLITALPDLVTLAAQGGNGGLLDWFGQKNLEVQTLIRAVSYTVAVTVFLFVVFKGGFAWSKAITMAIACGFVVWVVHNMTVIEDTVGNEVEATSQVSTQLVGRPVHA